MCALPHGCPAFSLCQVRQFAAFQRICRGCIVWQACHPTLHLSLQMLPRCMLCLLALWLIYHEINDTCVLEQYTEYSTVIYNVMTCSVLMRLPCQLLRPGLFALVQVLNVGTCTSLAAGKFEGCSKLSAISNWKTFCLVPSVLLHRVLQQAKIQLREFRYKWGAYNV